MYTATLLFIWEWRAVGNMGRSLKEVVFCGECFKNIIMMFLSQISLINLYHCHWDLRTQQHHRIKTDVTERWATKTSGHMIRQNITSQQVRHIIEIRCSQPLVALNHVKVWQFLQSQQSEIKSCLIYFYYLQMRTINSALKMFSQWEPSLSSLGLSIFLQTKPRWWRPCSIQTHNSSVICWTPLAEEDSFTMRWFDHAKSLNLRTSLLVSSQGDTFLRFIKFMCDETKFKKLVLTSSFYQASLSLSWEKKTILTTMEVKLKTKCEDICIVCNNP